MQISRIAVIDDELDMRQSISQWLTLSGFETETFASAREALAVIKAGYPGIVMTDLRMPEMDGMALLRHLMGLDSALPVILITGHGDVPAAVEAMRIGAFDFLEKPFDPERLTELARKACKSRALALTNRSLRDELSSGEALMRRLIGTSPVMVRLREEILDIAQSDGHVLICGETGTGKTLVAQALHAVGPTGSSAFVRHVLGTHSGDSQAEQLFGQAGPDGALSGESLWHQARGGTLVLEDVEVLSEQSQARMLALLKSAPQDSIPRIIAVCNRSDGNRSCDDILRADLYHRLAGMRVDLPPLRDRGDDVLSLFTTLLEDFAEDYGCDAPTVTAREAAELLQAPWPGNVRQMMNVAERAVLQARRGGGTITSLLISDTDSATPTITPEGRPLKHYVETFEKMLIETAMRRHRGSIAKVMDELSLPRRTLNEKMAKYGLNRGDYL
ncbi:MAG: sigma-54 dependent transcriptional regulator [Mangrovicoccus sp.]|nr:sigma-54 dependent transcriptional regulator [Mangrovicoccus sp.]